MRGKMNKYTLLPALNRDSPYGGYKTGEEMSRFWLKFAAICLPFGTQNKIFCIHFARQYVHHNNAVHRNYFTNYVVSPVAYWSSIDYNGPIIRRLDMGRKRHLNLRNMRSQC